MIEIDRSRVSRPAVLDLDNPNSLAAKETAKAITDAIEYIKNPDQNPKPKFDVYSHDDVKLALIKLFNLKCAYCEAKVTSARDIEHFRPKGRIDPGTGDQITPGYYWLAADWDNLLLSCPDCNQSKRALLRDENGDWTFAKESTGKLDHFPLRNESKRVTSHEEAIKGEENARLLLNPCKDRVTKYLRFDDQGNIIPRQVNGAISDMAKASIGTYVLWRTTLVEERKAKYLKMADCWFNIEQASQMIAEATPAQKDMIGAILRKNEVDLIVFTHEQEEYAGMARWLIKPLLKDLKDIKLRFAAKFGT